MAKPRSHSRGFTLLELIIVMLLLSLFAAMVSPSLRNFWAGQRMKNAASDVLTLMRYAQTQAIADSTTYRLLIESNTCRLAKLDGVQFTPLGNSLDRGVTMPEQTQLQMRRPDGITDHIDFFPDGRTEPAQLQLSDNFGDPIIIEAKAPAETFRIVTNKTP